MFRSPLAVAVGVVLALLVQSAFLSPAWGVPVPGGTLNPLTIPKYVTPLVLPPVMPAVSTDNYAIAARQFKQQILPPPLPATTVWSYGNAADNTPTVAPAVGSSFNYPAFTVETISGTPVRVRWINELVAIDNATRRPYPVGNPLRTFLPHLLPIDQTVHWANPPATGCTMGLPNRTDCATNNPAPYAGPVPLITHLHGAHVDPHSDGYPEAWYLPVASNIPAGYSMKGSLFDDATGANPGNLGYADFRYRNDNPATTLWYHDHAIGMTRSNVYAGPAGFWLVRGGPYDNATVGAGGPAAVLPGPAPRAGDTLAALNTPGNAVRNAVREIPIAIQDRSFNTDGSLFYPNSRLFFDNFPGPYTGSAPISTDLHPLWNPEAFFNTMVVNGTTWPVLNVAPALYRFRLLNGCNSRMVNLSMCVIDPLTDNCAVPRVELPFYQIGAEQGFLSQVVQVKTGFATPLPGNGTIPAPVAAIGGPEQALLMGSAERADVIVDFRGILNGTKIRMINTGADSPFGGFPIGIAAADNATTAQVMQFVIDNTMLRPSDNTTTPPASLALKKEPALPAAVSHTRQVSINELESRQVCVTVDALTGAVTAVTYVSPTLLAPAQITATCAATVPPSIPMAPQEATLGIVNLGNPAAPLGVSLGWTDETGASKLVQVTMADNVTKKSIAVTENPKIVGGVAPIEEWQIYNFTIDGHPIHLHLVEFEVISRVPMPGMLAISGGVQPWESGYKDTVIAYPGEITTVRARFDIPGLYVWHCHIVEHEDNEMMRPYVVSAVGPYKKGRVDFDGDGKSDIAIWRPATGDWWVTRSSDNTASGFAWGSPTDNVVAGDYDGDGKTDYAIWRPSTGQWWVRRSSDNTVSGFAWGSPTDVAVPGDYDGDGKADYAIWRPSTGQWWIHRSLDNATVGFAWGSPTDVAVPGDYDGDGKTDYAVWRPSTGQWWVHRSLDNTTVGFAWGSPTDVAVPGDYDGDGKTDFAVWRSATAQWLVTRSSDNVVETVAFGAAGDVPVPGDYDDDGKTDFAVWRPSTGQWLVQRSSNFSVATIYWGSSSDVPLRSR